MFMHTAASITEMHPKKSELPSIGTTRNHGSALVDSSNRLPPQHSRKQQPGRTTISMFSSQSNRDQASNLHGERSSKALHVVQDPMMNTTSASPLVATTENVKMRKKTVQSSGGDSVKRKHPASPLFLIDCVGNGAYDDEYNDGVRRKKRHKIDHPPQNVANSIAAPVPRKISDECRGMSSEIHSISSSCVGNHYLNADDLKLLATLTKYIKNNTPKKYRVYTKEELRKNVRIRNEDLQLRYLYICNHKNAKMRSKAIRGMLNAGEVGLLILNRAKCKELAHTGIKLYNDWTKLCSDKNVPFIIADCGGRKFKTDPSIQAMVLTLVQHEHQSVFKEVCKLARIKFNNASVNNPRKLSVKGWLNYLEGRLIGGDADFPKQKSLASEKKWTYIELAEQECSKNKKKWACSETMKLLKVIHMDTKICKFVTGKMFFDSIEKSGVKNVQNFMKIDAETLHRLLLLGGSPDQKRTALVVCNQNSLNMLENVAGVNLKKAHTHASVRRVTRSVTKKADGLSRIDCIPSLCVKHGIPYAVVDCKTNMQKKVHWIYGLLFTVVQKVHPVLFNNVRDAAFSHFNCNNECEYLLSGGVECNTDVSAIDDKASTDVERIEDRKQAASCTEGKSIHDAIEIVDTDDELVEHAREEPREEPRKNTSMGRGRGRGVSNLPAWMTKPKQQDEQNNGPVAVAQQEDPRKNTSMGRGRGRGVSNLPAWMTKPKQQDEQNNGPWVEVVVDTSLDD